MTTRLLIVAGGVAAAVVLFLLVRPGDEDDAAAPATTTTSAPTTSLVAPPTAEPQPAPEPEPTTIRILVQDGRPVGGIARETVQRGERVRLVVRADVADHVHLHGYDVMRDVAPGAPAQLVFAADIPGVFEAELEDLRLQILELEVRP